MTIIKCQDGTYVVAEHIESFHIERSKATAAINGKVIYYACIVAKSDMHKYYLGRYLGEQVHTVLKDLIDHILTNRDYEMPDVNAMEMNKNDY